MTVRSNHSSGCAIAKRLTSVGFARGSMVPPIRIIDAGWQGSPAAADPHVADPEYRPIVGDPGIGEQLHRGRGAPHQRSILDERPWLGQHAAEKFGHQANRGEYVAVYLISVVKHISSNLPAPVL